MVSVTSGARRRLATGRPRLVFGEVGGGYVGVADNVHLLDPVDVGKAVKGLQRGDVDRSAGVGGSTERVERE